MQEDREHRLRKIIIPATLKGDLLLALESEGVHEAELVPDPSSGLAEVAVRVREQLGESGLGDYHGQAAL